jgi:phosphopentomutase
LLVTARWLARPVALGVRRSFADVGQTLAEWFGQPPLGHGLSFLAALR